MGRHIVNGIEFSKKDFKALVRDDGGHEHEGRFEILSTREGGKYITLHGFSSGRRKYKEGDRILVHNSGQNPRYRVEEARFPSDPNDQFFLDCMYFPRRDS